MSSLNQLGVFRGTDNSSILHDYLNRLEHFLLPWQNAPLTFVEAGVLSGNSLRTWHDFFIHEHARLFGLEIEHYNPDLANHPRAKCIQTNCTHPESIEKLRSVGGLPITVFFDDASHMADQTVLTFKLFWPQIENGGLYIVSDLHAGGYHPDYRRGETQPVMQFFAELVDKMNCYGEGQCGKRGVGDEIDFVHFSKSFAIIKKL
jgi:cephalosporin hydroxylase